MVGAKQLNQLATLAGPAMGNMSDRGVAEAAILSQYMGAQRAGTAIMSMNQQFAGGTMWTRNATELQRLGILHEGEWHKGGGGGIVMSPEARQRLGKALVDPMNFVVDQLIPAMEKAGIVDQDAQVEEIYSLFGRQTSQRAIVDIVRNHGPMGLELGRFDKGQNLDQQLKTANDQDVEQNLNNLKTAWQNFLYALAGPNNENTIAVLKALTNGINMMSDAARNANPDTIKKIGEGIAILGAALIGAGAVALIAALGPAGWIVLCIGALAAAVVAIPWKAAFEGLCSGLQWFGQAIESLWSKIKSLFGGLFSHSSFTGNGLGGAMLQPASLTTTGATAAAVPGLHSGGGYAVTPSGSNTASLGPTNQTVGPNGSRPFHMGGTLTYGGQSYHFGSGGAAGLPSVPYGDFALGAPGPWGAAHGAIGLGTMFDPKLGRNRLGIEMHAGHGGLLSEGCIVLPPAEFAKLRPEILDAMRHGHHLFAHVTPHGIDVDENGGGSPAIPHTSGREIHLHSTTHLDGRIVAQNTMKHIVGHGNSPQSGARSPDYLGTRPLSI